MRLFEDAKGVLIDCGIVNLSAVAAPVYAAEVVIIKVALFSERFKVDKIRISCVNRKALVRRITIACRRYGEYLPAALFCFYQKINKIISFFPELAYAVLPGKGRNM